MLIAIDSNGPTVPSGYGKQAALLGEMLRRQGHEVVYFAFSGSSGSVTKYRGQKVYPSGTLAFGLDVIVPHLLTVQPDVMISIRDWYKLEPAAGALGEAAENTGTKLVAWLPIDGDRLSPRDKVTLDLTRATPVAMSEHGARILNAAGYETTIIPHTADMSVYKFDEQGRAALREGMGVDDCFVIGLVAANADAVRKCFPEQMRAFANLAGKRKDVRLVLHTLASPPNGLNLFALIEDFGLAGSVIVADQYAQIAGMLDDVDMSRIYSMFDVLTACSMGEGFCVPAIEANACGTPLIATDCSALAEHGIRPGNRLVGGEEFWNPNLHVGWVRPSIKAITRAYQAAYSAGPPDHAARAAIRRGVEQYDTARVSEELWRPFVDKLGSE